MINGHAAVQMRSRVLASHRKALHHWRFATPAVAAALVGWLRNLSARIGSEGGNMAEEIRAPLAGTVLSVLVQPGAKIDVDDELLVIEAMKMENLVYAPCAGAVKDIKVSAGEKVDAGDLLLVIE
jgi:biotin carboxyl carrier protein